MQTINKQLWLNFKACVSISLLSTLFGLAAYTTSFLFIWGDFFFLFHFFFLFSTQILGNQQILSRLYSNSDGSCRNFRNLSLSLKNTAAYKHSSYTKTSLRMSMCIPIRARQPSVQVSVGDFELLLQDECTQILSSATPTYHHLIINVLAISPEQKTTTSSFLFFSFFNPVV